MAQASIDQVYRMQCENPACMGWWSVVDPQTRGPILGRQFWCPWCGTKQSVRPIPPRRLP